MTARISPLFTWRSAIADSNLSPTTTLVAYALSLHMSERGDAAWPSQVTLMKETRLGKTAIKGAVATLEAGGWLRVERPALLRGMGNPNRYTATIPNVVGIPELRGPVRTPQPEVKGSREDPEGVTSGPLTRPEHVLTTKTLPTAKAAGHAADGENPKPPRERDVMFDAIAEACGYDLAMLPKTGMGHVAKAAHELRAIDEDPSEVARFAIDWRKAYPSMPISPGVILKHWAAYCSGELERVAKGRR